MSARGGMPRRRRRQDGLAGWLADPGLGFPDRGGGPGDVFSGIGQRADHCDRLTCLAPLSKPAGKLTPGMIVAALGPAAQLINLVVLCQAIRLPPLVDARGGLRLIASSDERMRLLELFEIQGAQGPCLDAFSSGRAVQANAADSRVRWPVFAPQASGAGFQVMCAVPLRVRTDVIGALNLFRRSDEPFTGTEMEIAQAMAEMAAIRLIQERALRERNLLAAQLQAALNSRVIIEQAKGMIAEYLTVTVDAAFKLLRNYAHYHNRKLSEVASDVVDRRIPSAALGRPHGQQI